MMEIRMMLKQEHSLNWWVLCLLGVYLRDRGFPYIKNIWKKSDLAANLNNPYMCSFCCRLNYVPYI